LSGIDHTHDAETSSWVEGADAHSDFPVQNLPLGVFAGTGGVGRIGAAIGDHVLDLAALAEAGRLPDELAAPLAEPTLNALFALQREWRLVLRHMVFALLTDPGRRATAEPHLRPASACEMLLPLRVGDYTDFYVGIHHATNIGKQFRPDQPLLPNYKHVPIGYHGRASSVRVSGAPLVRPCGQRKPPDAETPEYGPSRRLDFELELGIWIAGENPLGEPVPIARAGERIAGLCLLNDWSARDLQAWEYQPLGPFLAKNFLTSVSPWVVTAEALAPFRIAQAPRGEGDPRPLGYLWDEADQAQGALALDLVVELSSARMRAEGLAPVTLSRSRAAHMYWTMAQMIAHHAANGCNLLPGDLLGTGTISGPDADSLGSLMEISRGGAEPVALPTGESRSFLEDGDELVFAASASAEGHRTIGFGRCAGTVEPARC
jgi:fumarylacetoacetase